MEYENYLVQLPKGAKMAAKFATRTSW